MYIRFACSTASHFPQHTHFVLVRMKPCITASEKKDRGWVWMAKVRFWRAILGLRINTQRKNRNNQSTRGRVFRMGWCAKQFWGCLCWPMACGCGSCLLYPPSLFLLYDVNGRVLPSGTVILRIEVSPSIVSRGAREAVRS